MEGGEIAMPRKNLPELNIVSPGRDGASTRPPPPADLDVNERRQWLELVNSCSPTHFRPSDGPLLRAYVAACGLHQRATDALKAGFSDYPRDEVDWLIGVQSKAARSMCILSTKLRLNPLSRLNQAAATRTALPPSYYQQLRAERQYAEEAGDSADDSNDRE